MITIWWRVGLSSPPDWSVKLTNDDKEMSLTGVTSKLAATATATTMQFKSFAVQPSEPSPPMHPDTP